MHNFCADVRPFCLRVQIPLRALRHGSFYVQSRPLERHWCDGIVLFRTCAPESCLRGVRAGLVVAGGAATLRMNLLAKFTEFTGPWHPL